MGICGHTTCTILSIMFYMSQPIRIGLFIFELETYYSFKLTSLLVRHILSPKKNDDGIGKTYCLISWSPICTLLILLLTSIKIAGISSITV